MNTFFDLTKLNELLRDFYNLAHIRVTIYDDSIREITAYPKQRAPICRCIRTDLHAEAACHACDIEGCRRSLEQHKPYIYRCHAGLTEAVTPVMMGNVVIAYLSFGHLFSYPTLEEGKQMILSCCEKYNLNREELQNLIGELHETEESLILSAANILKAVAAFLCLNQTILLKQEAVQIQLDKYISNHFTEEIEVDTLCRQFGIGRTTLYTFSKQNYGMGISQHIRALRIDYAKRLLLTESKLGIDEVAEKCGFSDYNYFITVFSRIVGMPPRRYRIAHLENL